MPNGTEQALGSSAQTRDGVAGLVCGLPSRKPWLRTTMIVALHGHSSTTNCSASIARGSQVMSRHRLISRVLVRQRIRQTRQPITDQLKPFAAPVFDGVPLRGRLASTGSRCRAERGRGKRAVRVRRVGLHQHTLKLHRLQQLASGHNALRQYGFQG